MAKPKTCWACKRTLISESKLGLCPNCMNKYGSPAATVLILGAGYGVSVLAKNGDKILKVARNVVRL